jgi:hypothetical protein
MRDAKIIISLVILLACIGCGANMKYDTQSNTTKLSPDTQHSDKQSGKQAVLDERRTERDNGYQNIPDFELIGYAGHNIEIYRDTMSDHLFVWRESQFGGGLTQWMGDNGQPLTYQKWLRDGPYKGVAGADRGE